MVKTIYWRRQLWFWKMDGNLNEDMLLEIETTRLKLIPFTKEICEAALRSSTAVLTEIGIAAGHGWPDADTLDTLPRILKNLNKVQSPSGFESWMVLLKHNNMLIGDIGFKGLPNSDGELDLGYGIIANEQKKGFAKEAASGLVEWAFRQAGVKVITASCFIENLGSQSILRYLNFEKEAEDAKMLHWKLEK
jgi:ribosomal-protein-alanine N-acetyltransferase